ncbi:hypothetical protein LTR70_005411 [Exophiala xenobiotica]|uniref:Uncharacterized protein n=1 Tax=Lithohypha guttulata TaxID=1690604 RepID=A0ABR0K9M3_9EURO|nr:hypothetical protein LTR24_005153 [Lithohypha guttulata]KAK5318389.1 hypothetical protein LTR70_005411 [Exophiala xenobiotica]
MAIFGRRKKEEQEDGVKDRDSSEDTLNDERAFYKKPTGLRIFIALVYLIAVIFLILVEIGNINKKAVIKNTYFLKINLANVIPESVPNAVLINTIAQSLGLHDFYQVGLWNYCAGYNGEGITYCSPPTARYWFNPVEIIMSELLFGATISLPTELTDALSLVRTASQWMFACFIVGACLSFLCIFLAPLGFSKKPRWSHKARRIFLRQLPITVLTALALLFTAVGAVVATVMFVIFKNKFSEAADFNIEATLGTQMLAFEWVAVGMTLIGFLMQLGTCCGVCCCTGKRKAERKRQSAIQEKH